MREEDQVLFPLTTVGRVVQLFRFEHRITSFIALAYFGDMTAPCCGVFERFLRRAGVVTRYESVLWIRNDSIRFRTLL
jgi:hypothetical protein